MGKTRLPKLPDQLGRGLSLSISTCTSIVFMLIAFLSSSPPKKEALSKTLILKWCQPFPQKASHIQSLLLTY